MDAELTAREIFKRNTNAGDVLEIDNQLYEVISPEDGTFKPASKGALENLKHIPIVNKGLKRRWTRAL